MNKNKAVTINCVILSLLFLVLLSLSIYFCYGVAKNVPDIIEYNKAGSEGIDFKNFEEEKNKKHLSCTSYAETICSIKNCYGITADDDLKSKAVLTDADHFSFYKYKFVAGGAFDRQAVLNGSKTAVISEKSAVKMYKTVNVIGNKFYLNDEAYTISGVYKDDDSFIHDISEDGYQRIIIPYSSYKGTSSKKMPVADVLTISADENSAYGFEQSLSSSISMYNKENLSVLKKINFQYLRILFFIIGCFAIILLIRLIISSFKHFHEFLSDKLKLSYLKEIIFKEKKQILKFLIEILLILVLIVIVFSLIKFNPVFEDKYLPPENIFDLSFYKEAIVKNTQLINAGENGFVDFYNRYLSNISSEQKVVLPAMIIILLLLRINMKSLFATRNDKHKKVSSIFLFFLS